MNVSSATSSTARVATPAAATARAADGDFKTKGAGHEVKDSDGDYKATPAAAPTSAAGNSSSAVQSALSNLKKGG